MSMPESAAEQNAAKGFAAPSETGDVQAEIPSRSEAPTRKETESILFYSAVTLAVFVWSSIKIRTILLRAELLT
jgi:hypothetical protein